MPSKSLRHPRRRLRMRRRWLEQVDGSSGPGNKAITEASLPSSQRLEVGWRRPGGGARYPLQLEGGPRGLLQVAPEFLLEQLFNSLSGT